MTEELGKRGTRFDDTPEGSLKAIRMYLAELEIQIDYRDWIMASAELKQFMRHAHQLQIQIARELSG